MTRLSNVTDRLVLDAGMGMHGAPSGGVASRRDPSVLIRKKREPLEV